MAKRGKEIENEAAVLEDVPGLRMVYEGGEGEITEKKSRFIATVRPVRTEDEAAAFIAEMKKKYWDARHNCSAYVLGEHQEITRCSDDGEPAQTAGRPMLDVLLKERLTNAAVVVTRYFGGVLLGTGGLVRAYQGAVAAGLAACCLAEKKRGLLFTVTTDYNGAGKLQYYFAKQKIAVTESKFEADVSFSVIVPLQEKDAFCKEVQELTNGAAKLGQEQAVWYVQMGERVEMLTELR